MKLNLIRSRRSAKFLYTPVFVAICLAITSPSIAQWPTNYLAPHIVGGGTDARAGDIMAAPTGGAIALFDGFTTGVRQLSARYFDSAGELVIPNIKLYPNSQFVIRTHLLKSNTPLVLFYVYSHRAMEDLDVVSPTFIIEQVKLDGTWTVFGSTDNNLPQGELVTVGNLHAGASIRTATQQILIRLDFGEGTEPIAPGEQVSDFDMISVRDKSFLFSYTRSGQQPVCPREIWLRGATEASGLYIDIPAKPVQDGTGQDQFNSELTDLGSSNLMVSWFQTLDGVTSLYVKPVTYTGSGGSPARKAMDNVVDYSATSTTLGLPAFAAVQQNSTVFPPVDTLIAGLINPSNGGTLTIPVVSGPDVKVKDVRQMANGDFRLTYSTLEGGTNLLKVRGISGITGGTLWETTVADLGIASDETIETFPNTFVDSNNDNTLYILARYDQLGTANSLFQVVRLRADGTMGGN